MIIILSLLIVFAMISIVFFPKLFVPLFYRDKWRRKELRIICDRKLSINDIASKYYEVLKEKQKEEKMLLRKEKLEKLKNL